MKGIERLDIPAMMVTDGPHGLRKQAGENDHLGSMPAYRLPVFHPPLRLQAAGIPKNCRKSAKQSAKKLFRKMLLLYSDRERI